jgi:NhaA family Na+:H+ antiporter
MHDFFKRAAAPGIVLAGAALLGLLLANSAAAPVLSAFLGAPVHVGLSPVVIVRPVSLWINDGLMSVFFFLVGLEIKREIMTGTLSSRRRLTLPLAAALGGMLVPAALYTAINWGNAFDLRGWAIPSATDIAFALAAISLLGSRVPLSARVFLTAVAVIDDLGAVLIIAFFYTESVSPAMLMAALACFAAMLALNLLAVRRVAPYVVLGLVLWVFMLESMPCSSIGCRPGSISACCRFSRWPMRASRLPECPRNCCRIRFYGVWASDSHWESPWVCCWAPGSHCG